MKCLEYIIILQSFENISRCVENIFFMGVFKCVFFFLEKSWMEFNE
jgi:hypothetical protein